MGEIKKPPCRRAADGTCLGPKVDAVSCGQAGASASKALLGISSSTAGDAAHHDVFGGVLFNDPAEQHTAGRGATKREIIEIMAEH